MRGDDRLKLHFVRVLDVPREVAFRAQVDPAELAQWWGPRGFTVPSVEIDARVGGCYRITMQPPEGDAFHLSGEFLELEPNACLVYTFRWEEPDPEDRETTVTVILRERGQATELTVDHGGFATEARRAIHLEGWTDTLDRLEAHVSGMR